MSTPLRLQGVSNIRDLGGIRTTDGHRVRDGRVYRSASLHEMTSRDRSMLRKLGITVIVDLRSGWERDRHPYEIDFGRVVHAPLASDDRVRSITERFMAGQMTSAELEDWWELTGIFDAPEQHVDSIAVVFGELLAVPDGEAILYHCRGGKDRTGLITALFLEALGVPRELVAGDFMRSDMLADDHVPTRDGARMRRAVAELQLTPAALKAVTSVDRAWLDRLMEGIEVRHGSVQGYLADVVGIGAAGIERLRAMHLDTAPAIDS